MLLRNYHNILAGTVLGAQATGDLSFADGYLTVKSKGNKLFNFAPKVEYYKASMFGLSRATYTGLGNVSASTSNPRFVFGTGDKAVTYDDYTLENEYLNLSKASFVVGEPVYDPSQKKYTSATSFVLTNTGASAVTLKEMGIYMDVYVNGGELVLVYREVLDTPITIAAGDSVKYTHTFEFAMPTVN